MSTSESNDTANLEELVAQMIERQQAQAEVKRQSERRRKTVTRRRKQMRQMMRSIEAIKWSMFASLSFCFLSMLAFVWTAMLVNRTTNRIDREITEFRQTVYHPVENAAAVLGRQVDEKIEAYFNEKSSETTNP
ncbi:MAG: hypothetical protein ACIALR_13130 [Blastopirellula sp. JB062]